MPHRPSACIVFILVIFLSGCQQVLPPPVTAVATASAFEQQTLLPSETGSTTPEPTQVPFTSVPPTPSPASTPTVTPLPAGLTLDPADWHDWPVIPIVPEFARLIYERGIALGNDPHAFSVFGDCQSEPKVFMGVYETDPALAAALPGDLMETVDWFRGSFNRKSSTVRGGTTAGAVLWPAWHRNRYNCTTYETPLQCELRTHKPSFVILHVGTHYESRNQGYMRTILDQLIAAGVVPILASKADNRESDEHVNAQYAQLAVEYSLPFWNFWAAVDNLPNRGLYTREDAAYQGDLYLTEEAAAIQRITALQMLDVVRRAVAGP